MQNYLVVSACTRVSVDADKQAPNSGLYAGLSFSSIAELRQIMLRSVSFAPRSERRKSNSEII